MSAATGAYLAEPKTAANGWTAANPGSYIGQTFVANVDSVAYIEWFVGELSAEGRYQFEIRDKATNVLVCQGDTTMPPHGWQWVRCDSFVYGTMRFTKGKEYLLKVYHSNDDSVNFVYRTDDPYEWGEISVGGGDWNQPEPVQDCDLVCRVVGVMDAVDSTYWGFNLSPQVWNLGEATLHARADSARVGMSRTEIPWTWLESEQGSWDTCQVDTLVYRIHDILGCEMVGMLAFCPGWASSRLDGSEKCPPRNLFEPVFVGESTVNPDNYWARYVDFVVRRYRDSIKTWECWNEPHMLHAFWQVPDTGYGVISADTLGFMCALYSRLCLVADSVIEAINAEAPGDSNRLFVLSISADSASHMEWMRDFYEIAENSGCGVFWDGVTAHPYDLRHTPTGSFDPALFEAAAETLRKIMRTENGDMGELWITEMGWRGLASVSGQRELQARNFAEVFTTAKATEAAPFARFDRMCWYSFLDGDIESDHGGYGVIDTCYDPKASLYASGQAATQLVGKRLNGRVLVGDSRDDSVRIYEFEDPATAKRMWVGWRNAQQGDQGEPTVAVMIPVRCDDPRRVDLDYDGSSSPVSDTAEPSGWLATDLANRPQFIYEPEVDYIARPDLRADSVWSQPPEPQPSQQCSLYVRVINHGSAATPDGSLISGAPNTVARFYLDDSLVGTREYSTSIGMGDTVLLAAAWTPNAATQGLLKGTVNDDQAYVEEAPDDNAAYLLIDISN